MQRIGIAITAAYVLLGAFTDLVAGEKEPSGTVCAGANGDGFLDISDTIHRLSFRFQGGPPPTCSLPFEEPEGGSCSAAAELASGACQQEVLAEFRIAVGRCANLESPREVEECSDEAQTALAEALERCDGQIEARLAIRAELGEDPHVPDIDPEDFGEVIDDPFLPPIPGTTRIYEKETLDGTTECVVVTVTEATLEILGVECSVVRDTVSVDGELVEDTYDRVEGRRAVLLLEERRESGARRLRRLCQERRPRRRASSSESGR
jgi:hypothetical protein